MKWSPWDGFFALGPCITFLKRVTVLPPLPGGHAWAVKRPRIRYHHAAAGKNVGQTSVFITALSWDAGVQSRAVSHEGLTVVRNPTALHMCPAWDQSTAGAKQPPEITKQGLPVLFPGRLGGEVCRKKGEGSPCSMLVTSIPVIRTLSSHPHSSYQKPCHLPRLLYLCYICGPYSPSRMLLAADQSPPF